MLTFIAFIILIYLIFANRSLSSRLSNLESKLKNTTITPSENKIASTITAPQQEAEGFVASMRTAPATPATAGNNIVQETKQDTGGGFGAWVKEDWLMKLGAFLFIIGFGWFVSYAFANNWVGPVGRISIGIVAGIAIMALGFWRMMKYPSQGAVFTALGAGMAMLTIFAGRALYGFFTPTSAVFFDFIIVAFVSYASYKFNVRALAHIAQILAFVSPLLTAGKTEYIFLFSYLLFISLATLFLASVTGWRALIRNSLIFVGMYSLPFMGAGSHNAEAQMVLNFAYVFSIMYLLAGMWAVVKKGVTDSVNEIMLAVLNGLFLFLWISSVVSSEWRSMIFAVFAVIFAVSSFVAFKFSEKLDPFYAYGSVAVAFIAAATAAQLEGATLTIAFIVEVSLLVAIVLTLTKNIKVAVTTSWLFVAPALLSLTSVFNYANSKELFTKDFAVLSLMAIALIVVGRFITHYSDHATDTKEAHVGSVFVIFGTFYIVYLIWQFMHILLRSEPDMATMATLLIYTVFGLIAYFAGLYGNDMARRTYGMALLAFVVARLILIDVWNMELFGRVVTFLVIGILLMSTAFLTKKQRREHEELIVVK